MAGTHSIPIGTRFGRWTITGIGTPYARGVRRYTVRCDCGKIAERAPYEIRRYDNCGCLKAEKTRRRFLKHGKTVGTTRGQKAAKVYNAWHAMIFRCTNPKARMFPRYGGRGIKVYEPWMTFANFLADMGEPLPGQTLDRIDNDGNYEPSNCRWATNSVQQSNRANNRHIETRYGRHTIAETARLAGMNRGTLGGRIARGITGDDLFLPVKSRS